MIDSLIGTPYKKLGKSLDGFDCWGLVWYLYNKVKNANIDYSDQLFSPQAISDAFELNRDNGDWVKTTTPVEYDVCLMYKSGRPVHIGIWHKRKILNALESRGVCLLSLTTANRMFEKVEFYSWQP